MKSTTTKTTDNNFQFEILQLQANCGFTKKEAAESIKRHKAFEKDYQDYKMTFMIFGMDEQEADYEAYNKSWNIHYNKQTEGSNKIATVIFNKETESKLKSIITDEFIQASKIILSDLTKANDINNLSANERMKKVNADFAKECSRVYIIGELEKMVITANAKQENGEELTADDKQNIAIYNGYISLVHNLYPIAAARHIAFNPNASTVNAIHSFALMTAKMTAYIIYENTIKKMLSIENIYC